MLNLNWIEKLKIECIDEPDETMSIHVEWDETDPELEYWTSLGQDGQETFIVNALNNALSLEIN
jgi:hypothetical protein